jgi:carbon-monoxide dehydrogenase large subunit
MLVSQLGVDPEQIKFIQGDTDAVAFGMGTGGSRSTTMSGGAIVAVSDKIVAKGKKLAAHLLEASEGDIEFKDGRFTIAGTDRALGIHEIAKSAFQMQKLPPGMEPGLYETATYRADSGNFPNGCHICEVEIDPETGDTEIAAWTAVDDFGTIINPMIVEGQVHGGVAQGVGQALLEHTVYDDKGQLLTGSYMDYAMPRADNLPSFKVETTMTKCPSNPLGIKGCGEAGANAAPAAVMNAITDAIGHERIAMPATPSTVWAALQKSNKMLKAAQ